MPNKKTIELIIGVFILGALFGIALKNLLG